MIDGNTQLPNRGNMYTPNMTRRFDRFVQRHDDPLSMKVELAVLVHPSVQVLAQSFASDGHVVALNAIVL